MKHVFALWLLLVVNSGATAQLLHTQTMKFFRETHNTNEVKVYDVKTAQLIKAINTEERYQSPLVFSTDQSNIYMSIGISQVGIIDVSTLALRKIKVDTHGHLLGVTHEGFAIYYLDYDDRREYSVYDINQDGIKRNTLILGKDEKLTIHDQWLLRANAEGSISVFSPVENKEINRLYGVIDEGALVKMHIDALLSESKYAKPSFIIKSNTTQMTSGGRYIITEFNNTSSVYDISAKKVVYSESNGGSYAPRVKPVGGRSSHTLFQKVEGLSEPVMPHSPPFPPSSMGISKLKKHAAQMEQYSEEVKEWSSKHSAWREGNVRLRVFSDSDCTKEVAEMEDGLKFWAAVTVYGDYLIYYKQTGEKRYDIVIYDINTKQSVSAIPFDY